MAFPAETSGQKCVLWWAARHRVHHRHADQDPDITGVTGRTTVVLTIVVKTNIIV